VICRHEADDDEGRPFTSQREDDAWLVAAVAQSFSTLSPRERAVLLAAARGAEDKEIAAKLGCSVSTVRTLWQRTYRKTRELSRRMLIARAWKEACRMASLSTFQRRDKQMRACETGALRPEIEISRSGRSTTSGGNDGIAEQGSSVVQGVARRPVCA
jgi:DNA-binding CsgD family transcriptional regulator